MVFSCSSASNRKRSASCHFLPFSQALMTWLEEDHPRNISIVSNSYTYIYIHIVYCYWISMYKNTGFTEGAVQDLYKTIYIHIYIYMYIHQVLQSEPFEVVKWPLTWGILWPRIDVYMYIHMYIYTIIYTYTVYIYIYIYTVWINTVCIQYLRINIDTSSSLLWFISHLLNNGS